MSTRDLVGAGVGGMPEPMMAGVRWVGDGVYGMEV